MKRKLQSATSSPDSSGVRRSATAPTATLHAATIYAELLLLSVYLAKRCSGASGGCAGLVARAWPGAGPSVLAFLTSAGRAAAFAGPLATWLPLALAYAPLGSRSAPWRPVLAMSASAWLVSVHFVRSAKHALPGGFDPSGHVVLFALQLAPLWALRYWRAPAGATGVAVAPRPRGRRASAAALLPSPRPPPPLPSPQLSPAGGVVDWRALFLLRALEALLVVLSIHTAVFHHTPAEVAAGAAVGLAGVVAVAAAAARPRPPARAAAAARAALARAGSIWAGGAPVALALALAARGAGGGARAAGELLHDAAVWLAAAVLVRGDDP